MKAIKILKNISHCFDLQADLVVKKIVTNIDNILLVY